MDYRIEMPTREELRAEEEEAAKERWWDELSLEDHVLAIIDSCIIGDALRELGNEDIWKRCIHYGDEETDLCLASEILENVLRRLAKEASK